MAGSAGSGCVQETQGHQAEPKGGAASCRLAVPNTPVHVAGLFGPRPLGHRAACLVGSGMGWGWGEGGVQLGAESLGSAICAGCPPGAPAGWDLPGSPELPTCLPALPPPFSVLGEAPSGHRRPDLLLPLPPSVLCPADWVPSAGVGGSCQRTGATGTVRVLSCAHVTSCPPTGWHSHALLTEACAFHRCGEAQCGSQVQADLFFAEPWERAWLLIHSMNNY